MAYQSSKCSAWASRHLDWEAPAVVKPITAEVFAQLAIVIETGTKMAEWGEANPEATFPCLNPSIEQQAAALYEYIPAAMIPVEADDRPTIETFKVGREALMAALKQSTPPQVLTELGDISGADAPGSEGGLNWWAMALSAGGFLSWVGKSKVLAALVTLTNVKKYIFLLAAGFLYALATYGIISEIVPGAKKVLAGLGNDLIINPAKTAGSFLGIVVGLGIVAVGTVVIYNFTRTQNAKTDRRLAAGA